MEFDSINQYKSKVGSQAVTGKNPPASAEEEARRKAEEQRLAEEKRKAEEEKRRAQIEAAQRLAAAEQAKSEAPKEEEMETEPQTEPESAPVEAEEGNIGAEAEVEEPRNLERVARQEAVKVPSDTAVSADMFGGLMYYGDDLAYHMDDISKQMRPYLPEAFFKGAKSYLTYTKGDLIHRMNQGQFLSYLLIKAFPPEIRRVIMREMPSANGNDIIVEQLKEDEARESSPASLVNIANSVQEISDQMRLMLDADLSRDEMMSSFMPALLYAATWLLADRMDLREKMSGGLNFNEYLRGEQIVPPSVDNVLKAGEDLQTRLNQKNNEARSGNIYRKNSRGNRKL